MPAGWVFFNNGISIQAWGSKLINGLITAITDETDLQMPYVETKDNLMFHEQMALSEDEKFTGIAWPLETDEISENWVKNEWSRTKLPDKGFEIIEYGEKLTTSYLMYQWIQKAQSLKWASNDIKKQWKTLATDASFLIEGTMMRMTMEMLRVYTKGFGTPTASEWPGSPTPKGNPLFSINHTSRNGALTWRNMGTTGFINEALTLADGKARIQNALAVMRTVMRLENGEQVARPKAYDLLVSSDRYEIAGEVLNINNRGKITEFAQEGSNSSKQNVFNFEGARINLVELPKLGDIDKHGNSIGASTNWFLRNPLYVNKTKCFKMIKLYSPFVKNYKNEDTDAQIVDIRIGYAVDHYGAECGVFGSKGDGDSAYAV